MAADLWTALRCRRRAGDAAGALSPGGAGGDGRLQPGVLSVEDAGPPRPHPDVRATSGGLAPSGALPHRAPRGPGRHGGARAGAPTLAGWTRRRAGLRARAGAGERADPCRPAARGRSLRLLPSLGLCLLLGRGHRGRARAPALGRRWWRARWCGSLALAALTWSQVQVWRDTDTLFVYTLAVAPDCAWCQHQYGGSLGNRGQLEPAITHFQNAVALLPDRVVYHYHLGLALLKAGRPGDALPHLQQTVAAQAWNLDAATNLGLALVALGRPAEALPHLQRVAAARPDSAEARRGLEEAQRALGR